MFYDLRLKYADREERAKIKKLEMEISTRLETLAETIRHGFSDYVSSFGITGPMAHGEGTIFFDDDKTPGSDIDLAIVTKYRSFRRQREIENEIKKTFQGCQIEAGPLIFSPSIFKRPDLLFIEYAAAGKILFGKKHKYKGDIPVWEAAKLLVSRCGNFFESISFDGGLEFSGGFNYGWSKSAMAPGEAVLILEHNFAFTLKERASKIKKSKIARQYGITGIYEKAYKARYTGKTYTDRRRLIVETASALSTAFLLIAEEIARKSGKHVGQARAPFPSIISTRYFFFRMLLREKKLGLPLEEPMAKEFLDMWEMLELLKKGQIPEEKKRRHVVSIWKDLGRFRFWLPY